MSMSRLESREWRLRPPRVDSPRSSTGESPADAKADDWSPDVVAGVSPKRLVPPAVLTRALAAPTPPATRSASSLSTILSKMGSRIDRFFTVRRTSGRKRRKSWPSELASDVRATSASRLSSFTGPSRTRTNGWTTAEA